MFGADNAIAFTYRIEDARIGRFLSIDPLAGKYPMYSPYHFSSNQPIHASEFEGLESRWDLNSSDPNFMALKNRLTSMTEEFKSEPRPIREVGFDAIQNSYPPYHSIIHVNTETGNDYFSNHCAINLSHALVYSGVDMSSFSGQPCYGECPGGENIHAVRATELASWLLTHEIEVMELNGENFREEIEGKKGIIYFENYWQRSSDPVGTRTGDHIDLWETETLESIGWFLSGVRKYFPEISEDYLDMSQLEKSERILFWEIKHETEVDENP